MYGPTLVIMEGFILLSHLSVLPVPERIPDITWFPPGLITPSDTNYYTSIVWINAEFGN